MQTRASSIQRGGGGRLIRRMDRIKERCNKQRLTGLASQIQLLWNAWNRSQQCSVCACLHFHFDLFCILFGARECSCHEMKIIQSIPNSVMANSCPTNSTYFDGLITRVEIESEFVRQSFVTRIETLWNNTRARVSRWAALCWRANLQRRPVSISPKKCCDL